MQWATTSPKSHHITKSKSCSFTKNFTPIFTKCTVFRHVRPSLPRNVLASILFYRIRIHINMIRIHNTADQYPTCSLVVSVLSWTIVPKASCMASPPPSLPVFLPSFLGKLSDFLQNNINQTSKKIPSLPMLKSKPFSNATSGDKMQVFSKNIPYQALPSCVILRQSKKGDGFQ